MSLVEPSGSFLVHDVDPPVAVANIWPGYAPSTAKHTLVVGQLTASRDWVVPDVCGVQSAPPLVVARIMPFEPTAKHADVVGQLMPCRLATTPEVRAAQ